MPNYNSNLPAVISGNKSSSDFTNEREILYKVLFDMRNDITDLKKLTQELIKGKTNNQQQENTQILIDKIYGKEDNHKSENALEIISNPKPEIFQKNPKIASFDDAKTIEKTISLQEKEFEMIKQALERNKGKRKLAAKELGISERTLYRKINQYNL